LPEGRRRAGKKLKNHHHGDAAWPSIKSRIIVLRASPFVKKIALEQDGAERREEQKAGTEKSKRYERSAFSLRQAEAFSSTEKCLLVLTLAR
jgi:hypothetical protein